MTNEERQAVLEQKVSAMRAEFRVIGKTLSQIEEEYREGLITDLELEAARIVAAEFRAKHDQGEGEE